MAGFAQPINLRAMGFCGIDDSCSPELLLLLSAHYSWIEWGVLFRPDLEGTPRYASSAWLQMLVEANKQGGHIMRLAAHLCQSRCQEALEGDGSFIAQLKEMGFARVQINATAANSVLVDPTKIDTYVDNLKSVMTAVPAIEFIIQCNDETKPIWSKLVTNPPPNMSVLFDASCGKGTLIEKFTEPFPNIPCGYAGGIGPTTIDKVLTAVRDVSERTSKSVWIDMESSLRSIVLQADGQQNDVFSVEKCFKCVKSGVLQGLPSSRFTLLSI